MAVLAGVPAPKRSLPRWQKRSRGCDAMVYVLLFALIVKGWSYASMRGWTVNFFGPLIAAALVVQVRGSGARDRRIARILSWVLLGAIALHVAAAFAHFVSGRDGSCSVWPPLWRHPIVRSIPRTRFINSSSVHSALLQGARWLGEPSMTILDNRAARRSGRRCVAQQWWFFLPEPRLRAHLPAFRAPTRKRRRSGGVRRKVEASG